MAHIDYFRNQGNQSDIPNPVRWEGCPVAPAQWEQAEEDGTLNPKTPGPPCSPCSHSTRGTEQWCQMILHIEWQGDILEEARVPNSGTIVQVGQIWRTARWKLALMEIIGSYWSVIEGRAQRWSRIYRGGMGGRDCETVHPGFLCLHEDMWPLDNDNCRRKYQNCRKKRAQNMFMRLVTGVCFKQSKIHFLLAPFIPVVKLLVEIPASPRSPSHNCSDFSHTCLFLPLLHAYFYVHQGNMLGWLLLSEVSTISNQGPTAFQI